MVKILRLYVEVKVVLETERLLMREFVEGDWVAVLAYQSDPLYLRYYHWMERTEADVRAFVGMFLEQQRRRPRLKFQLALILKQEDRLIGNCGIRVNDPGLREANIGYEVDSRYWGHGYATEAARAILRFGFEELRMRRIWSYCLADNVGSARVLEKIGMRQEGRLREKEFVKGQWHDHLLYALLDHEWPTI
ncbi:MAG: GNAT family N-acetyltransferase [Chloroflexi bacterium]|nr:GNAT family N-acetyltransferase [Chloroflexota bacterium]